MANELTGPTPTTSTVVPSVEPARGPRVAEVCASLQRRRCRQWFDAAGDPRSLAQWWRCSSGPVAPVGGGSGLVQTRPGRRPSRRHDEAMASWIVGDRAVLASASPRYGPMNRERLPGQTATAGP
jgi:hypothetical protein